MKRIVIAAAVGLVVLAAGAAGVTASPPAAHLRGFSCQHAIRPVARSVSITAVMRPIRGTKRMSLRFELLSKTRMNGPWSTVSGGDLGHWVSPANPTLGQRAGDVWILHKSVIDLAAPASYRYEVSFRWIDGHEHTLGSAVRWSGTCTQRELRPDLVVRSIDVRPMKGDARHDSYTATIDNDGATAARRFRVQFAAANGTNRYDRVALLPAHSTMQLPAFIGPACSSSAASTVTADPDGAVDDFNRANNTMTAVCSSPAGQP
jgi:hypothetical protein